MSPKLRSYPELFCAYYDELDEAVILSEWLAWERDDGWRSLMAAFRGDVQDGRPVAALEMRVNGWPDRQRRLYAACRAMDEAFAAVNAYLKGSGRTPRGLVALEAEVAVSHRLHAGEHGALIPRLVRRGPPVFGVDHLRDLFSYVLRVPKSSWERCDFRALGAAAALDSRTFDIACVPMIAEPDEIEFATHTVAGRRVYHLAPRDDPATFERVGCVVEALDRSGVQVAMVPESMLTPVMLERWQACLARPRRSRLRWVLAGAGDLGKGARNTAVLLEGRTGSVICTQDKLYPFDMSADVLRRWQLTDRLGDVPIGEDLGRIQRRLTVLDAGRLRIAILICEDLNRVLDLGPLIRDIGVTHLLVPVFSLPIKPHRWEQSAAAIHARETGAIVIVANSLVMPSVVGASDPGTSLVVPGAGKALIGRAGGPGELVRFRLHADGTAEAL